MCFTLLGVEGKQMSGCLCVCVCVCVCVTLLTVDGLA